METLSLAIGRNAAGHIESGHFGDSNIFVKYLLHADGSLVCIQEIPNPSKSVDETHGASDKMKAILNLLAPIHCVISGEQSPNFKRMALQSPIQPVVVKSSNEEELRACLSTARDQLWKLVASRQAGERNPDIPVLGG